MEKISTFSLFKGAGSPKFNKSLHLGPVSTKAVENCGKLFKTHKLKKHLHT